MKARIIAPGTAAGARLTAGSCAILAVLVSALVCACSPSGSPAPDISPSSSISTGVHPTTATVPPTPSHASKSAPAAGGHASKSLPAASPSDSPTPSQSPTHRPSAAPTKSEPAKSAPTKSAAPGRGGHRTHSRIPAGAPATGGGGTAGLQNGTLLGIGAAAILVGLAALGYRRRLTRTR